jgi:SAM-dependent methyltransferase
VKKTKSLKIFSGRRKVNNLNCRFCRTPLKHVFVDLGLSPVANDFVPVEQANQPEVFYPLKVYVCQRCFLVQIPNVVEREAIFNDHYAYFSSISQVWLDHAKNYVVHITQQLKLNRSSLVVELASNDGYLLQYFKRKNIPVLGIEPSANVAQAAKEKGIPTLVKFFGRETAKEVAKSGRADLIIANNVLAHVPDLNDFVAGLKILLAKRGVITVEFPHLLKMIQHNEFDTIYHEHYSYYSLTAVEKIFAWHGLEIFDVEEIPTHGGSLRLYVAHAGQRKRQPRVIKLRQKEIAAGIKDFKLYDNFRHQVTKTKIQLLEFLIRAKKQGKKVVAYGAPAKGNTLLNFCGIRQDLIKYTVDKSPYKQKHLLPGTRIPIFAPGKILATRPDYVLILPWNLKDEVIKQLAVIRKWGGKFVVPIPKLKVIK